MSRSIEGNTIGDILIARGEGHALIARVLNGLFAEQTRETDVLREESARQIFPHNLLRNYLKSEDFKKIYKEAARYCLMPFGIEQLNLLRDLLAGSLYHSIVYQFLSKKVDGGVLFSPDRTLKLYEVIYPGFKKVKHGFNLDSLSGVSVPDGVIIKKSKDRFSVVSICEYSLRQEKSHLNKKNAGVEIAKQSYSSLFTDAGLLFVVPKDSCFREEDFPFNAEIIEIPFSSQQFGKFTHYVFNDYSLEKNCATLSDIQERACFQEQRGANRLFLYLKGDNSSITQENKSYLLASFDRQGTIEEELRGYIEK